MIITAAVPENSNKQEELVTSRELPEKTINQESKEQIVLKLKKINQEIENAYNTYDEQYIQLHQKYKNEFIDLQQQKEQCLRELQKCYKSENYTRQEEEIISYNRRYSQSIVLPNNDKIIFQIQQNQDCQIEGSLSWPNNTVTFVNIDETNAALSQLLKSYPEEMLVQEFCVNVAAAVEQFVVVI